MTHASRTALVLIAAIAPRLGAQPAPRLALGLSLDASSVPDAFSARCGRPDSGGTLGGGASGAVVLRPRGRLVVQASAHYVARMVDTGCDADLPTAPLPNGYETRPGARFPRGTPGVPLVTTVLRLGVETPCGPLVRASIGGGMVWGGRVLPLGVAALTLASRRAGVRWMLEYEQAVSTTRAVEHRAEYSFEGSAGPALASTSDARLRINPTWGALRGGVEIPLRHAVR